MNTDVANATKKKRTNTAHGYLLSSLPRRAIIIIIILIE